MVKTQAGILGLARFSLIMFVVMAIMTIIHATTLRVITLVLLGFSLITCYMISAGIDQEDER